MKKLLAFGHHRPDTEALSALLDARLGAARGAALDAHVAGCDACRARLADLRAVRDALRAMPSAEAPRSFRLRAADVERARPLAAPGGIARALPLVSAAAAAAFVVLIGAGVYAGDRSTSSRSSLTAYTGQQADSESQPARAPEGAAQSPETVRPAPSGKAIDATPATGDLAAGDAGSQPPPATDRAPGPAGATAPDATADAYRDAAAPMSENDHSDRWWYAAAAAGVVAASTAGAALYARRKRDGI